MDVRGSCIDNKYFQIALVKAGVRTVVTFVQKPSNSIVAVSYASKYVHFLSFERTESKLRDTLSLVN